MVNNAGICTEAKNPKPIDESDEAVFDAHTNVNVKGTFLGCKYAVRQMKKQDPLPSGDRGFIVNLASIVALVGMAGMRTCP
jgi:NAD(P)-dependent dehydrogenase (short-subunit alcohol dehydrogenase family)